MIERLEKLGFKVIVVTGDAVAPSHTFFHMHGKTEGDVCYKTKKFFTDEEGEVCVFHVGCPASHKNDQVPFLRAWQPPKTLGEECNMYT